MANTSNNSQKKGSNTKKTGSVSNSNNKKKTTQVKKKTTSSSNNSKSKMPGKKTSSNINKAKIAKSSNTTINKTTTKSNNATKNKATTTKKKTPVKSSTSDKVTVKQPINNNKPIKKVEPKEEITKSNKNQQIASKSNKRLRRKILIRRISNIIIIIAILGISDYYLLGDNKRDDSHESKEVFNKMVKDTKSPVIEADDLIITVGDNIDLLEHVFVKDDFDKEVKVTVIGDYNINKVGSYKITYSTTDSSNNTATKEITLTVKEKTTTTTSKRVDFTTSKGFKGYTENGVTYINGVLVVNKTYSLPSNYGNGLTTSTNVAFEEMKAAALTEGLSLWICSGFRSYTTQAGLYNSYVNRDGVAAADTYSARAGHSEHQSGLAMDINLAGDGFNNTPEAQWLSQNAYKYGFILRYPNGKTNETGYKYESWHYRYVGVDLATKLYNDGDWITLEDYFGITSEYNY